MANRTNSEWVQDLKTTGPVQEAALADLHQVVLSGLPYALSRWLPASDPRFQPLAEEAAQETLLRVLDHLDSFEGRSQFTTWVHKIAVRSALTDLRRKRWENISLDELVDREHLPAMRNLTADPSPTPEAAAESADILATIQRMIDQELTEKQRRAIIGLVQGMPMEEVARRLGTNRNALYKLLHDTRLRLKHRLAQEGLSVQDVLAVFEKR